MPPRKPKTPLELAARALCRTKGLPEDMRFQGAKMWQAHLGDAMAILQAALPPDEFRRHVLDHPWPGPIPPDYAATHTDPDN
ncbi:hypothetical protein [Ruixingdingia sedimenti]|uniref:Uncharacterized protein n=1 Tax=Ruixingdingia sedimenti TaxID=3073604 RepID=A0ABU1FF11_9RHOB|nr:hypothetical protein [Xinfangfangia sp. LG-4]MDR5655486.1 hypothetical protein [Xinfangfangia sp. LG-4]